MMLARNELAELSRSAETELVLSVYLARETSDPGQRGAWRIRLDTVLSRARLAAEDDVPEDLPAFDAAAGHVLAAAEGFGRVLPAEGWAAFATDGRLLHETALPFPPPEMVRWRQGVFAAPYVRGLKLSRPVIVAIVDQSRARVMRYQHRELSEPLEVAGEGAQLDMSDVGMSKRTSTVRGVSGMRGATRTDAAQRTLDEEARRLRERIVSTLVEMAGEDGSVLLGGPRKAVAAVLKELEEKLPDRVAALRGLSLDATREELLEAAAGAASALTAGRQARILRACAKSNRSGMGWNETYRALAAAAVDTLLVARGLIESSPDDAERLVRLALAQGADIEEVGDEPGDRLMEQGGGTAARLRFVPASLHV